MSVMPLVDRFLRRLVVAFPLAVLLIFGVDRWVVPLVIHLGYLQHCELNQLTAPPVDEGAGSHDIHYLASVYDCTAGDLWVVGEPPPAGYWMVGLYDNRMRMVPGAHLNDRSIQLDDDGRYRIHLTHEPTGGPNELDCSTSPTGMLVVRMLRPEGPFTDPWLEDHSDS